MRKHLNICRQPVNTMQVPLPQPAGISMLMQMDFTMAYVGLKTMHAQMKIRIIPFYSVQKRINLYTDTQFLANFAYNSRFPTFTSLYLATGELPAAVILVLRAFNSQHLASSIEYNSRNDLNNS